MVWRVALAAVVVIVAGVAVYVAAEVWRWGCPSQEELDRPRSVSEVVDAFSDGGLPLERVRWPAELRRARAYRGAVVFRHDTPGATLHVVVCRARCGLSRFQLRPGRPRASHRFGFSGLNVGGWIAGEHAGAARLQRKLGQGALDDVYDQPDPGSRCYIG
jgi:hypothetical protein